MSIFRKQRNRRHVKRDDEDQLTRAGAFPVPDLDREDLFEPPKKRHWPKRLGIGLISLILILLLAAGIGFVYITSTPLKGEAAGRINILVMGVDNAAKLSDTLMIVSIDTHDKKNRKVAFISIPRDLYVNIPGRGNAKINAAYSYGRTQGKRDGGVKLSKQTIEDIFDIPIHYYAAMDFKGFRDLIDTIGGVDVNVKTAIDDPYYPAPGYRGYQPFSISAGQHHLDGTVALAYARSRKTTTDYDRAARQQQIIVSAKKKLLSSNVYLHKSKIDEIRAILDEHVITNISTREALKLGKIARELPASSVSRHVIDSSNYLAAIPGTSDLVPREGMGNFSAIKLFIKNIFSQKSNNLPANQQ